MKKKILTPEEVNELSKNDVFARKFINSISSEEIKDNGKNEYSNFIHSLNEAERRKFLYGEFSFEFANPLNQ